MADASIVNALFGFFGAIVGGGITVLLGPWVAERFKLREVYFIPFKTWCTEFYGELEEFSSRYTQNLNYSKYSDILIILDYRSLHESLINAPKWFGKIEKDNKDAACELRDLLRMVEIFWHYLENTYPKDLPSVEGVKEFNMKIKCLESSIRKEIADKIRHHMCDNTNKYKSEVIMSYLKTHIPN